MTRPEPLTDNERAVYQALYETTRRQGYQPSLRELAALLGWTGWSHAQRSLDAIKSKGWIDADPQAGRAIRFRYRPDGQPFSGFADRKTRPGALLGQPQAVRSGDGGLGF